MFDNTDLAYHALARTARVTRDVPADSAGPETVDALTDAITTLVAVDDIIDEAEAIARDRNQIAEYDSTMDTYRFAGQNAGRAVERLAEGAPDAVQAELRERAVTECKKQMNEARKHERTRMAQQARMGRPGY